jgi:hypothetical protein
MAESVNPPGTEAPLDESPAQIVSRSRGRPDIVLHTVSAWQAPGYMIALALALAEAGWNPYPSYLCGVHLYFGDGITSIYAERAMPTGSRRLL